MTFESLQALLRLTLSSPRAAAAQVMAQRLPLATGWTALLLVSVLSTLLGYIAFILSSDQVDPAMAALFASPLSTAVMQVVSQAAVAVLAWRVGRSFGGSGGLPDALALVAWAQVPLIVLQAVQLVLIVALPALAPILGLAAFAAYVVILSLFIAELHGFKSGIVVFFGMLATSFLAAFVVALLMFVVTGGVPNV